MAFGIDDALAAAAAGISLTDTLVRTVQAYQKRAATVDFEQLIDEVRTTIRKKIDDADIALTRFEIMLKDRGVALDKNMNDVIMNTPFWRPFEQYRLKQFRRDLQTFTDSVYASCDDIAALARCQETTGAMGQAVVESVPAKHELHKAVQSAASVSEVIELLRKRLAEHKAALS